MNLADRLDCEGLRVRVKEPPGDEAWLLGATGTIKNAYCDKDGVQHYEVLMDPPFLDYLWPWATDANLALLNPCICTRETIWAKGCQCEGD